jgi:hypothetical protein
MKQRLNQLLCLLRCAFFAWLYSDYYVILDGRDNSVTLNSALIRRIRRDQGGELQGATIFSYIMPGQWDSYCFSVNAPVSQQVGGISRLQMNTKYRTIGFESLCPTVQRIIYDYRLGCGVQVPTARVYVRRRHVRMASGTRLIVYQYLRPWNS